MPALPEDVAARLDAALADAALADAALADAATTPPWDRARDSDRPRRQPASDRRPDATPPDRPPGAPAGSRRPGRAAGAGSPERRRRRRGLRWGSGLALAAAAVAFAAVGLDGVRFGGDDAGDAGYNAATRDSAEEAPGAGSAAEPVYVATGTDYRRGQVPDTPAVAGTLGAPDAGQEAPQADQGEPPGEESDGARDGIAVPPALAHLRPLPETCRSAVLDSYDPTAMIEIVDYATFEGQAAMVIWVTTGGERWVSIAGPDCGSAASGADERHRTRLD